MQLLDTDSERYTIQNYKILANKIADKIEEYLNGSHEYNVLMIDISNLSGNGNINIETIRKESYLTDTGITEVGQEVPKLTRRESDVLQLIAKGLSYNEVASVLIMSAHTVTSHIKNIYKKLSVHSRGEAVFEAMQLGLVH